MNPLERYAGLIGTAEHTKFFRGALLSLAPHLPPADSELDELLRGLVLAKNEVAFLPLVFAALASGRSVDARHLAEGAALFEGPHYLANAALHCTGPVGEALVAAVKRGSMGAERDAVALLVAAFWARQNPERTLPGDLIAQARIVSREHHNNLIALDTLMALANFLADDGLKKILRGFAVPEHPLLEQPLLENLLPACQKSPLHTVPEAPPPLSISGFTVRRAVERVGRNDPCPCGSGRKYKKCCFEKDRERLAHSSAVPGVTQAELRQQPELGLSEDRINQMRSYELCKLDPEKVPGQLRLVFADRLILFGLLEQAVAALEKWPWDFASASVWDQLLFEASRRGDKAVVQRLLALSPERITESDDVRLGVDLLLAGEDEARQLDLVEAAAQKALKSDDSALPAANLAYSLLERRPALGIIAARSVIPMLDLVEAATLLDELLKARDKLQLSPHDPVCDVLEERLYAFEEEDDEVPEELTRARQQLQAKAREMQKLQKELTTLHGELKEREAAKTTTETQRQVAAHRMFAAPAALSHVQETAPPAAAQPDLKALRDRIESLQSLLKERHNERNAFRRELQAAREQIERLRVKPASAEETQHDTGEDQLLEPEEIAGRQPVRLPEFPRKFEEVLASLPPPAARSCLVCIGRLAAGDLAGFAGVKRLKALPDVFRQRIADHYRLLFRLLPGKLQILDLIHRRDLERKIKSLI